MVPLQIILTHQGVRKYLLAKWPKLFEVKSLLNHHLIKLRYWKNNDVHSTSLYVEEPEMLRKMGSEKEKLVIDIFISRKLKCM